MSATDALTITSALDALTRYYCAKEREESAVLYINDAYLEVLNSLENLEAENDKLQNDADLLRAMLSQVQTEKRCYMAENAKLREACAELLKIAERHDPEWLHWPEMHEELRKLRVEVDDD